MSVLKSVRIPEDIYEYIMDYNGDGFNQKFVNIIKDARDSEDERNIMIAAMDKEIVERRKYLEDTSQLLHKTCVLLDEVSSSIRFGVY